VLGFVDEPQVELADPYGAFYSRVLSSPDKSVRIPVNIGDGGATAVSRFIETFGGGGVQQLAFATDDLFAFVENAREAGVPFLTIPDNYYEDLDARYGLEPELIERMRTLGVLYDRTKGAGITTCLAPPTRPCGWRPRRRRWTKRSRRGPNLGCNAWRWI
jgi:4-hydroxyphenylpyruvate dioxygenase